MSIELVCPEEASTYIVPGSHGEEYMVKFFVKEKPVCTCPAYRFSGEYDEQTCKHIKAVREAGCFYNGPSTGEWVERYMQDMGANNLEAAGIKLFSTTKENVTLTLCPGCDKPMIEVYVWSCSPGSS